MQSSLFAKTHLRNTVGVAGMWGQQGLEAEVVPIWALLYQTVWVCQPCVGVGVVGIGGIGVCLPPTPNTDQSLVLAEPGQEGRTRPGQRLQSQQLRTLHLDEQPVVEMGRKEKHRKAGVGWQAGILSKRG